MNKILDKANASVQDFAQTKLLEFKKNESECELKSEHSPSELTGPTTGTKKVVDFLKE